MDQYVGIGDEESSKTRQEVQLDTRNAQEILDNLSLSGLAKKGCRKCYGRGHIAFNLTTGKLVICSCARKNYTTIARMVEKYNRELKELPSSEHCAGNSEHSEDRSEHYMKQEAETCTSI